MGVVLSLGAVMRRRNFIKVIAVSAAAWPLAARAQEPGRIYRVALIVPVGRDEPAIIAFLDELRSQGFVEGENLIVVPVRFWHLADITIALMDVCFWR